MNECDRLVGYIDNGIPEKAMELFKDMKNPDQVIFILFFKACASLQSKDSLALIKSVLPTIAEKIMTNSHLQTSVIDALMKCSDVNAAETLYNQIEVKSISVQGAMMKGEERVHFLETFIIFSS